MSTRKCRRRTSAGAGFGFKVGPVIRASRIELGLTATALAAAASIHKGHLSRIEHGAACSVAVLSRLAKALGRRPGELVDLAIAAESRSAAA